jgi:hypothetical protein
MWIRSAAWDGCWFLSSFPLAVLLTLAWAWSGIDPRHLAAWVLAIQVLDTTHRVSPMLLAWRHPGFRQVARAAPTQFVALPALLLGLGLACGLASARWWPGGRMVVNGTTVIPSAMLTLDPLAWLLLLFFVLNFWHFGRQNFGVMSIYRRRSGIAYPPAQRRVDLCLMMGIQAAIAAQVIFSLPATRWLTSYPPAEVTNHVVYVVLGLFAAAVILRDAAISGRWASPRVAFAAGQALILILGPGLWLFVINSVNHWLVEIGLCAHVEGRARQQRLSAPLVVLGICGAAATVIPISVLLLPPVLGLSAALGLAHFLYDRWVWKLSDPRVQATIGREF